jgi:hypothetical protein
MILLGLHGRMGSGKDTAASFIKKHYIGLSENFDGIDIEDNLKSAAFADPLKVACQAMFGGDRKNYFGTQEDKAQEAGAWGTHIGPQWGTYRGILQQFGTNVMRHHVHPDFWVYAMKEKIVRARLNGTDLFVITDVRFPNEAKMIRAAGGKVVHVVYTDNKNPITYTPKPWWKFWAKREIHPSERPLPSELVDNYIETSNLLQLDDRINCLVKNEIARNSTRRLTK